LGIVKFSIPNLKCAQSTRAGKLSCEDLITTAVINDLVGKLLMCRHTHRKVIFCRLINVCFFTERQTIMGQKLIQ
jgi:hypothetical protein